MERIVEHLWMWEIAMGDVRWTTIGTMRRCAWALALLHLMTSSAAADPILDFVGLEATGSAAPDVTVGWTFHASSPLVVEAIGIWDEGGDGLRIAHQAGLWTIDGSLIVETIVDDSGVPVPSSSPAGRWVFTEIQPLVLAPGTYVLGAFYPDLRDNFRQSFGGPGTVTTIDRVTHLASRIAITPGGLGFPDEEFRPRAVSC